MEKIPTAEEFLNMLDEKQGTMWTEDNEEICKAFIAFAKLHVEAALKAAEYCTEEYDFSVEIKNSYPLENIK